MSEVNIAQWSAAFDRQAKAAIAVSSKVQLEAIKDFASKVEMRTPVGDPSL